ncbi:hypothetical protein [Streptomyces sp. NPDC002889]|uniref:hypothetical protein n=1 Tax=Streptomyces sp. NPDC002889 TaxID=3364669 RepID=UPI00368D720F
MTTAAFHPTHVVPQDGLPAWEAPDVTRPTASLDPLLPVQLVERRGDWGQIVCANGWSAWVDGRLLVAVPREPPAAGQPLARTADPRALMARVEESIARYRTAAEDRAAGRTDGEGFRRRTQGLRVGMVVDGESVWLYEAEHERWVYCDGIRLSTLAADSAPSAAAPAPTRDAPDVVRSQSPSPAPPGNAPGEASDAEETQGIDPARPAGYASGDEHRGDAARGGTGRGDTGRDEPTRFVDPAAGAPDPFPHPPARPGDT